MPVISETPTITVRHGTASEQSWKIGCRVSPVTWRLGCLVPPLRVLATWAVCRRRPFSSDSFLGARFSKLSAAGQPEARGHLQPGPCPLPGHPDPG